MLSIMFQERDAARMPTEDNARMRERSGGGNLDKERKR